MNNDHWGAQETETRSELLHHCLHRHSETPAAAADVAERVADRVAECVAERVAVAVHCGADGNTVDVARCRRSVAAAARGRCRRSVAADLVPNAVAAVDIGYTCLGMLQYIVHFHAAAAAYTSLGAFEQAAAAAAVVAAAGNAEPLDTSRIALAPPCLQMAAVSRHLPQPCRQSQRQILHPAYAMQAPAVVTVVFCLDLWLLPSFAHQDGLRPTFSGASKLH